MNGAEEMPLLPIGSVVGFKDEIKKPVMIYGRKLEATKGIVLFSEMLYTGS